MSGSAGSGGSSTAGLIVGILGLFFLLIIVVPQVIDPPSARPTAGDSFSKDALGHSLLADTLAATGYEVNRIRIEPRSRMMEDGLLVLAEPDDFDRAKGNELLADLPWDSQAILVVLPKRHAAWGPGGRLVGTWPRPRYEIEEVLESFSDLDLIQLEKNESSGEWYQLPVGCEPPEIDRLQLLSEEIDFPIISSSRGVLFGAVSVWSPQIYQEKTVYILSDPDLIANHGFGSSDRNARLSYEIFKYLDQQLEDHDAAHRVYFDEVTHGHALSRGIWAELFRYPLALIVVHLAFLVLLVIWATRRNFGPRLPSPPAIPPGKAFLVDHVASVILQGGHDAYLVSRYLDDSLREVAHALHIEPGRTVDLEEKLMSRAEARGVAFDPRAWRKALRTGKAGALDSAQKIHAWRKEMLHGA